MGTKRPNCTHFDTTSNLNTTDYKLQSGGKISQDSCPRLKMTGPSERDRNATREENWKRDTESETVRDRARYREMDTLERPYERDRALSPRPREGEREWMERDQRQEHDLGKNGRLLSNAERQNEQEVKTGRKKGDTFPRIRKEDTKTRRMKEDEEREEMRQRDRPLREEVDEWERERRRNRYEESYEVRSRAKEEGKNLGGRRAEDERLQQRKRHNVPGDDFQDRTRDLRDSRERDVARRRERLRPDMDERETRIYSPHRRPDGEIYSDRRERENKREKRRDARSEGDIDEKEMMRCRLRDRERDEMTYQLSRSEGENWSRTERVRDRDRQYYTERLRQKEVRCRRLDAEKEREMYKDVEWRAAREADREEERWREKGLKGERREDDRSRGERANRERKERREDATDRNGRSPTDSASKIPTQVQSSREWSRDVDSKTRYRGDSDRYEERETRSERTGESERGKEGWKDSERIADRKQRQLRSERQERERRIMSGSLPEQRRMWLEPQRGKNSKDEFVHRETHTRRKEGRNEEVRKIESQEERGRKGRRVKEEPDERYLDPNGYKGRHGGKSGSTGDPEEVSVDRDEDSEIWRDTDKGGKEHLSDSDGRIEGRQLRDIDGGNVSYNTEESDREEEGGNHYCAHSESEGGSEVEWKQDRDRVLSGEDGFVTVSSGGDEENERDKENEFKYCQEFLKGGITHEESTPVGFKVSVGDKERGEEWTMKREEAVDEEGQGRGKYVFCVIGQTLSQSKSGEMSLSQDDQKGGVERNNWHLEFQHYHCEDDTQKSQEDIQLASNRNYVVSVPNKDSERDHSTSQEEDLTLEHTAEGEIQYRRSPELRSPEPGEEMKSKVEPLLKETGTIKRDSQTERLLKEWREKDDDAGGHESGHTSPLPSNPYADVCSQDNLNESFLDSINTAAMSVEELEAIKVRMNEAWSTSKEPKRRSQAPHLKWAKSVVREILGHSDEQTVDESITEAQGDQGVNQSESNREQEDVKQSTADLPVVTFTKYKQTSVPEREEEYPLDEYRGMGQNQADMHADQVKRMHVVTPTYTHADTLIKSGGNEDHMVEQKTEPSGQVELRMTDMFNLRELKQEISREKEVEMYLSVSNTLYKPSSCPILNYDSESDLLTSCRRGESEEVEDETGHSEEERQGEVPEKRSNAEEMVDEVEVDVREGKVAAERKVATVTSSLSFRDLGPEARLRRRGIRKTTERRNGDLVEMEEEEDVGRDRRARVFSTPEDDDHSKSWGEVDLRNVLDSIARRKRNSKIFNAAQLYQQYSEAAQNSEIVSQSRSSTLSVCEDNIPSPTPSPPPARRPLPPLPAVRHPHSLSHSGSITSAKSLPLPEPPKIEGRPPSPRLSFSISKSVTLWRDLPGVRNSSELEELTEGQRRLQEVRFEVVTSEASYCRSLDIVVEHFVKSKQLRALLTTQDRNWLFSRLADVRAISHSFLSKLEECVESDIMHFTVCDIIARQCGRFKMVYVPYLTNQSYQDATYQRLMNENPGFKAIVEKLERSPVCQRLPLRSFLVLPFQRITRIKLLVQNIVKRTTPGTPEAMQAIRALKLLEKLIQESNDSISQMKSIESLVSLSAKVDFGCRTLPLVSQSRRLVREGPVTELMDFSQKETERNVYLHLFNDHLLLSQQKEGGRFTVIDHCPVSQLRAENCRVKLHSLQKNLIRLHMSNRALLLRTDTQSDKLRWISALSRPHTEIDFSAAQDFEQMQCIRAFVAQQPDELSLEKADIILVHQESTDNWVEGTRLSDRHRGWVPKAHLETISSSRVRQRNLSDALKLTTATATV